MSVTDNRYKENKNLPIHKLLGYFKQLRINCESNLVNKRIVYYLQKQYYSHCAQILNFFIGGFKT